MLVAMRWLVGLGYGVPVVGVAVSLAVVTAGPDLGRLGRAAAIALPTMVLVPVALAVLCAGTIVGTAALARHRAAFRWYDYALFALGTAGAAVRLVGVFAP